MLNGGWSRVVELRLGDGADEERGRLSPSPVNDG